jgi:MFS transporter, BCD family, chlorophyll transporter
MKVPMTEGLGWGSIIRLGLVQAAIGAQVMLATSLLNRVMVVEYALPAALPAGLVAWHYAVQLSRPAWGHGSDRGRRRTPWIIGGMALLATATVAAVGSLPLIAGGAAVGYVVAILAFAGIGAGVGAAGTSLLALLASRVAPDRRSAAAAITWIMMVAGIVVTAGVAGSLIDPFSLVRLATVTAGVAAIAFVIATLAVLGVERGRELAETTASEDFPTAVRAMWADPDARRFTFFVFVAMLAYSMQDMILEPFAGLVFAYSPGASTRLAGVQHGGVLIGMILAGIGGSAFRGRDATGLGRWIVAGCAGSALALAGLAIAARVGAGWPIAANVAALGFANGVFAVSAIGAMMALAGAGGVGREGIRMGVWGAAQAIAFGTGGLVGAVAADVMRRVTGADAPAFALVFACEGGLFIVAALLSIHARRSREGPMVAVSV